MSARSGSLLDPDFAPTCGSFSESAHVLLCVRAQPRACQGSKLHWFTDRGAPAGSVLHGSGRRVVVLRGAALAGWQTSHQRRRHRRTRRAALVVSAPPCSAFTAGNGLVLWPKLLNGVILTQSAPARASPVSQGDPPIRSGCSWVPEAEKPRANHAAETRRRSFFPPFLLVH